MTTAMMRITLIMTVVVTDVVAMKMKKIKMMMKCDHGFILPSKRMCFTVKLSHQTWTLNKYDFNGRSYQPRVSIIDVYGSA